MADGLAQFAEGGIALLGLGMENRALASYLAARRLRFAVCDARAPEDQSRLDEQLRPWLSRWHVGPGYLDGLAAYRLLFRTPGLRPDHPQLRRAAAAGARLCSQTRLFAALSPAPLVGVTGTKGKGTTASLLGAMLEQPGDRRVWVGGNIGAAPIAWLGDVGRDDAVVLELSSFQLADWERGTHVAVVLRIASDHLDYHGSREAYVAAKARIAAGQGPDDWLLVDDDCPTARSLAVGSRARVLRFSTQHEVEAGAWVGAGRLFTRLAGGQAEPVCPLEAVRLRGRHNWSNVAAAAATARALGVGADRLGLAIGGFTGLPHRLQPVACRQGVTYYDDSLATTPEAAAAALGAFEEPVVLIAGGSSKQADFAPLARAVAAARVRAVVLIGAEAPRIEAALREVGWSAGEVLSGSSSMAAAVAAAAQRVQPGDVVLLAPACASFDMFRDYRHRGELFAAAATALP